MKIGIATLGCKVNQVEMAAMERELERRGHELVPFEGPADAYIVNTCAVTAMSGKKSRQLIRRARKISPGAVIGVCGCYAQVSPEEVRDLGVDLIGGSGGRLAFLDKLEVMVRRKEPVEQLDDALRRREFERLSAGGLMSRTRAMLKVEDGCSNFCAYCIIPYARGPVRSLPLTEAREQARGIAAAGYREIVITGIEISSWGKDLGTGEGLIDLIESICGAVPEVRVRLGSLEPRTITEEFCIRASGLKNLCPHFHLSLQSGCDETLRRMNRKYDTYLYKNSVKLLNSYFDNPALTTDLIAGFPGETEEEFTETLGFIRTCSFADMHIFPYSVRPGTAAAKLPQVPKKVKEERCAQAAAVAAEMRAAYMNRCIGKTFEVLYEQGKDGVYTGHAPNYVLVSCRGEGLHNRVLSTKMTGVEGETLLGNLE